MMVSDRLINFVKTFEELLFDSQKKIRELYDDRYLNKPFNNETTWEDDDRIYKMRVSMVSRDKTYCKDCSFLKNNKCHMGREVVHDKKIYCTSYQTDKSCVFCNNEVYLGDGEYCCDLGYGEYYIDNNRDNECPKWELEE